MQSHHHDHHRRRRRRRHHHQHHHHYHHKVVPLELKILYNPMNTSIQYITKNQQVTSWTCISIPTKHPLIIDISAINHTKS